MWSLSWMTNVVVGVKPNVIRTVRGFFVVELLGKDHMIAIKHWLRPLLSWEMDGKDPEMDLSFRFSISGSFYHGKWRGKIRKFRFYSCCCHGKDPFPPVAIMGKIHFRRCYHGKDPLPHFLIYFPLPAVPPAAFSQHPPVSGSYVEGWQRSQCTITIKSSLHLGHVTVNGKSMEAEEFRVFHVVSPLEYVLI